ncbi:DsbA family protein [Corynebacterium choanae]|uniref:DsbA family protein n=1 Tax=Corynebacterium choanae TaxID=1862358 RepID=UPI0013DE2122|nr:thioredoxin domain-containing protein [Corynebacterium choanae]
MASTVKKPNEKSNAFLYTLVAVLAIVGIVIGYIVINGKNAANEAITANAQSVGDVTVNAAGDTITLQAANPKADAREVSLYEDYSCPHCAELAEATDDSMLESIQDGDLIVHVHSLNFLDGDQWGNSSKAGAAAEAVAQQGDAELYWNYRKYLFDNQRSIYSAWDEAKFADLAKTLGASDATVAAITDDKLHSDYEAVATNNAEQLKSELGKISSPQVTINGKAVNIASEGAFADWPKDVVAGKYDS